MWHPLQTPLPPPSPLCSDSPPKRVVQRRYAGLSPYFHPKHVCITTGNCHPSWFGNDFTAAAATPAAAVATQQSSAARHPPFPFLPRSRELSISGRSGDSVEDTPQPLKSRNTASPTMTREYHPLPPSHARPGTYYQLHTSSSRDVESDYLAPFPSPPAHDVSEASLLRLI